MIYKEQMLEIKENEKKRALIIGSDEIKVMYTNIDGLIPRKLELTDYLKQKKNKIVCLAETELSVDIQTNIENNNNYSIWRKDKKGKK